MATSGNTLFQLTRDQIINSALRKLVVVAENETALPPQLVTGAEALNAVIASFRSQGMPQWARKELSIPMVVGQRSYTIGVNQAINTPYPIHVHYAILEQTSQQDVIMMARSDFDLLPQDSRGVVVNATYQPQINKGVFSVWPLPETTTPVTITYQAPFEYFISATDTPDFPEEWTQALIYGLAAALAPEYGIPINDRKLLMDEAKSHLTSALSNGTEDGSVFFGIARY